MAFDFRNNIDKLPDDLLIQIFKFLRLKDLAAILATEKKWNQLLDNNTSFFKTKFHRTQSETKNVISNLPPAIKKQYLNKESFDLVPSKFVIQNKSDLIALALISFTQGNSIGNQSKFLELLLSNEGKAALLDGWITVSQAAYFSEEVLSFLLSEIYLSKSKDELIPKKLIKTTEIFSKELNYMFKLEQILCCLFKADNFEKLNILGWNKLELVHLFFLNNEVLYYLLEKNVVEIHKYFNPKRLAEIDYFIALYIFSEKGMTYLRNGIYSIERILNLKSSVCFNNNFRLIHINTEIFNCLSNKVNTFEELIHTPTDILEKISNDLCMKNN